ncbi:MAG TPA: twin-arginine translocation signal domain-containing protein, partial [Pseudorhodoferax sp.]|nr:twin-arginine translocation signal domain-containing protein [Pseudorhodoferax sp.]
MTPPVRCRPARRDFIRQAGAVATTALLGELVTRGAWAAGSDAPEKKEVRIGFIPLT